MRFAAIPTLHMLCSAALTPKAASDAVFGIVAEHEIARRHKIEEDRAAKKYGNAKALHHAQCWLAANRDSYTARLRERYADALPRWADAVARGCSVTWVASMHIETKGGH